MKISVNEQTQTFYLAGNKEWVSAVGHEIRVGNYRFCAVPIKKGINISEVTSGAKILDIPFSQMSYLRTSSKEGTIHYFLEIGERLLHLIEKSGDFDHITSLSKQKAVERLGDKPPVEDYDSDWIFAEESILLN